MAYQLIGIREETDMFAARPGEIFPTIWQNQTTGDYAIQYVNNDTGAELKKMGLHADDGLTMPSGREFFVYYSNGRGFTEKQRTMRLEDGCPKTANRLRLAASRQPKRGGKNPNRAFRSVQLLMVQHPSIKVCTDAVTANPEVDAVLAWLLPDGRYLVGREEWLYQTMVNYLRCNLDTMEDVPLKQTVLSLCHKYGAENIPELWRERGLQACYRSFCKSLGFKGALSNTRSWSEMYFGFPKHQRRWEA